MRSFVLVNYICFTPTIQNVRLMRVYGVFDSIYLEHSTINHSSFTLSHKLPKQYVYYRLATRSELRDYMYNFAVWETMFYY